MTETSYINRLANRLFRSTVKTLPETLAVIQGHRLAVKASRLAPRGRRNELLGQVSGSGANWLEGFGGGTGFHISPLKIKVKKF